MKRNLRFRGYGLALLGALTLLLGAGVAQGQMKPLPAKVCASCKGMGSGPFQCGSCKGTGKNGAFRCNTCNGSGWSKCVSCRGTGR